MGSLDIGIPVLKPCLSSWANFTRIGDVGYMKKGEFCRLFNAKELRGGKIPEFKSEPYSFTENGKSKIKAIVSDGVRAVCSNTKYVPYKRAQACDLFPQVANVHSHR